MAQNRIQFQPGLCFWGTLLSSLTFVSNSTNLATSPSALHRGLTPEAATIENASCPIGRRRFSVKHIVLTSVLRNDYRTVGETQVNRFTRDFSLWAKLF